MSAIIGGTTGPSAFITEVKRDGNIEVINPNSPSPFIYPNWFATNAFFINNKIIFPRIKPPELIALHDTATNQFQLTYGMSYLSYYFYMLTDNTAPGNDDYDNLFIKTGGYQLDIPLFHSSDAFGVNTWEGSWTYENIDIKNIKGGISQIDITVSQQVISSQIVDKTASGA